MPPGDYTALKHLTQLGGAPLLREIASIYLDETPRRIEMAREALRVGDAVALTQVAHAMKSATAQLGGVELAAECEVVEEMAERRDLASAAYWFQAVESRFAEFSAWLSTQVSSLATSAGFALADSSSRLAGRPVVAVVEDNVDNRLLVDAILGDRFALDEYGTGVDALEGMRMRRPALVLLDVSLPGMDGLDVLARMRSDVSLRDVPVVAVTAHAMAGDRERYLAAGFDGYVPKPIVDERVLIDAVERLLARHPARLPNDDA